MYIYFYTYLQYDNMVIPLSHYETNKVYITYTNSNVHFIGFIM